MKESIGKTFGVATALCVVCAIIVSLGDVSLKGLQQKNKTLDRQVNILKAAGLVEPGAKPSAADVETLFAGAKVAVVDLATGEIVPDADPESVEKDKTNVVELAKEDDVAKIKTVPQKTVVYLFNDDAGALRTVVLPIVGTGLWSTMRGFLSLGADLRTVEEIVFYEHGETPGLGGEISNPVWTAKWRGKLAFDDSGVPALSVIKGSVDPSSAKAPYQVDGISGATLTGKGVDATVKFWLGDKGFGPTLKNLKNGAPTESANGAASTETTSDETTSDVGKDGTR